MMWLCLLNYLEILTSREPCNIQRTLHTKQSFPLFPELFIEQLKANQDFWFLSNCKGLSAWKAALQGIYAL